MKPIKQSNYHPEKHISKVTHSVLFWICVYLRSLCSNQVIYSYQYAFLIHNNYIPAPYSSLIFQRMVRNRLDSELLQSHHLAVGSFDTDCVLLFFFLRELTGLARNHRVIDLNFSRAMASPMKVLLTHIDIILKWQIRILGEDCYGLLYNLLSILCEWTEFLSESP